MPAVEMGGEEILKGAALFLIGDRPGDEGGDGQSKQKELLIEEQVDEPRARRPAGAEIGFRKVNESQLFALFRVRKRSTSRL